MSKGAKTEGNHERMIFTLPRSLANEIRRYADAIRGANKSGLVADAVRWYLDHLRKARHTARLRESYAQCASKSREINQEWQRLDDEVWARLDKLEARQSKAN
jgi:metal-responsive CopG/Arc/MetJ family transcriptional regulator